jgi:hypothetical protein
MSNAEFVASFSQERNRSFNTAVGVTTVSDRNTIPACVLWGAERDGRADGKATAAGADGGGGQDHTPQCGGGRHGKIQGERLDIEITSLEYDGTIIPVELAVYDTDGQPGIFIPELDGDERRQGGRRQHGRLAGQQHQHLHQCRGAARLRLGQGADTRHEPVHRQEDAYRQGASESRVQGHALSGRDENNNNQRKKTTTKFLFTTKIQSK